jgi:hypothetical protein
MGLLVVGLVVVVLIILVVVFLTVRSNRGDAEDDYPSRSARRDRYEADPDGGRRRDPQSRPDQHRRSAQSGSARDSWDDDRGPGYDDLEPATGAGEPVPAYRDHGGDFGHRDHASGQRQRGAVPAPRSPVDESDRISPTRGVSNGRNGRRSGRSADAGSGRTRRGGGRGKANLDWPTDWGKVSDEQYWAELSSDKPLATTARSAQQGTASRLPAREPDRQHRENGHRRYPDDRGPAGRSGPGRAAEDDDAPRREAVADTDGPETDPRAAAPAHWSRSPDEAAPAAPWTAAGASGTGWTPPEDPAPRWEQQEDAAANGWAPADAATATWAAPSPADASTPTWTARDAGTWESPAAPWSGPQPAAGAWPTEDPLTSPSFSAQSLRATDSRSYRGSHQRAQSHGGDGDSSDGYGYHSDPSWDSTGSEAASYAGHTSGWRSGQDDYSGSSLEPLPEPRSPSPGSAGDWYQAPASPDEPAAYAYSRDDAYLDSGQQRWQSDGRGYEAGYDQDTYAGHWNGNGADHDQHATYGQTAHYDQGADYGQSARYDQPASYGQAASYRHEASHSLQSGQGYGPGTDYDPAPGQFGYASGPGYGSVPSYAPEPSYDADSGDYGHGQSSGYGASEQTYGQGADHGQYPGYDRGYR